MLIASALLLNLAAPPASAADSVAPQAISATAQTGAPAPTIAFASQTASSQATTSAAQQTASSPQPTASATQRAASSPPTTASATQTASSQTTSAAQQTTLFAPAQTTSSQAADSRLLRVDLGELAAADQQTTSNRPTTDQQATGEPSQQPDPADAKKPPTPEHTGIRALLGNLAGDYTHLAHMDNVYVAALGGGLALAVHPFDDTFNVHLRSHYDLVNTAFAPAKYFGDTPEQVALSLGTYAVGRLFDFPKASHLGMDLLRAQILTESLVQPLKFAVGRQRPDQSNHQSFPSGHAAVTFAGATVIERHVGWKRSLLGYTIASYVAASRLHDNVHFLSDVVFGAAVGTIAGRTVTQHGREYWSLVPMRVPGGVAIVASRTFQSARSELLTPRPLP
jgi:membrane-associated phospholipid phosphatase